MNRMAESISEKISHLSEEQLAQVDLFLAQLQRDETERGLTVTFASLSNPALRRVWDNPDDDIYNAL
jgi:hypothetical protein